MNQELDYILNGTPKEFEFANTSKAMQQTKSIEYAYPSSPFAVANGFEYSGCWYVALYNDYKVAEYKVITDDKAQAVATFENINLPVNAFYSQKIRS